MDPTTYSETGTYDDDRLHWNDIKLLRESLRHYVNSGQPGMAALFVYNVHEDRSHSFCSFVEDLSSQTHMYFRKHQIIHNGGNKNLAALLYSSIDITDDFLQDAVEEIEDFALAAAIDDAEDGYSSWETVLQTLGKRRG